LLSCNEGEEGAVLSTLEKFNNAQHTGETIVYVYVATVLLPPTAQFPIIQSYVDVMLKGSAAISAEFLEGFIRTTDSWGDGTWLNDRYVQSSLRSEPMLTQMSPEITGRALVMCDRMKTQWDVAYANMTGCLSGLSLELSAAG
jgi:hypothetical protein